VKEKEDPEVDQPKLKYPRAIPFIVLNEFCERFNYYGMRSILLGSNDFVQDIIEI
jgi:dipeptide/tripeptide permease